jgi:hypothetical protein
MRLGLQSTLGVDSVVAAPAEAGRLGQRQLLLDGPAAGHIGVNSQVGLSTRL